MFVAGHFKADDAKGGKPSVVEARKSHVNARGAEFAAADVCLGARAGLYEVVSSTSPNSGIKGLRSFLGHEKGEVLSCLQQGLV